jgi:hypothetical protein
MEVYVKESLHVLDYKDNITDSIFISDDHMTPGYAYDISITEANTGYSDLTFNIPNEIINNNGEKIKNPKLEKLTPLVKLRYHRQVFYTGEETITVREPVGYGDVVTYEEKTYSNAHPNNIIENYIMDYIVQPLDKKRSGWEISTKFTAMDYPRFNLSKKKVGMVIATDTLTRDEWSLYTDKPMDVPGTIKYEPWTNDIGKSIGVSGVSASWNPKTAEDYPLTKDDITNLMNVVASWPYGLLATAIYWTIEDTARFEGRMYNKGDFLVLHIYDFYNLTTTGVDPDRHIGQYAFDWTQLSKTEKYLCPNTADNYLYHVLEGTNWTIKMRDDGKPDVDIVKKEIARPNIENITAPSERYELADSTTNISVSNGNCYNAITAICQGLQLYPVFDCVNREVSLKTFAGKNYGLTYHLGSNLNDNTVKNDGEKVITKLYVGGGKDYNGDANINIGEATRSFIETGNPDTATPWDPNDPRYIIKRSPYGTNYIYNFKWMFDNGWMTQQQIIDLYKISQEINDLNKAFIGPYTEDRLRTLQEYNDAVNNYSLKQGEYQSILNSMMNKYYNVYGKYSEGTFYAFHKAPLGTHTKNGKHYLWIKHCYKCDTTTAIAGSTKPGTTCSCGSTDVQVDEIYIPVYDDYRDSVIPPTNPEYPYGTPDGKYNDVAYEPHIKGDYLKLLSTLDRYVDDAPDDPNVDNYDIGYYEGKVSLTQLIPLGENGQPTIDGYEYKLDGVYTRASSGHIEEWNSDIDGTKESSFVYNYGQMLNNLRIVNDCLDKIAALEARYKTWEAESDELHASIQNQFGDYIVEGTYTNNEQPYVGLLFQEGMEASDKFAVPEVTYSLDVVDSTGLIEYRQPSIAKYACNLCHHTSVHPFSKCPKCGHTGIERYEDNYNDLVRKLHSVGQIVPKAGDYVTVYDEPMGMFGVPALITEITRKLDNPMDNKIKLDTSYTDDEELVGNIITATNTVLNNADIYARTAVLKADGTIDSESIAQTLNNPNGSFSIVGTNGNMLLTGSGLQFTDPADEKKAMKYTGTGIFSTTTLSENGEGTMWTKMITPSGINASYINAGAIDTQQISIMSGLTSKIILDEFGLAIKQNGNKSAHITTFDAESAKGDAAYASQWGTTNNLSTFIGVDKNKNPLMYTKGFLVAEEGSNIANWITSKDGFYHLNGTTKDLWLSPQGIKGTVNKTEGQFALYANGKFGVTTGGALHATDATISGSLHATSLTLSSSVDIPEENIDVLSTYIKEGRVIGSITSGENVVGFNVSEQGLLTATNAVIYGTIYAKDGKFAGEIQAGTGKIGGWSIGTNTLSSDKVTLSSATGNTTKAISINSDTFYVQNNGYFRSTSGKIGNWSIGSTNITNGNTTLGSNGKISFTNGSAYFAMGDGTNHPECSGLNVGTAGILFGSQSSNTSIDGDSSDMTLTYGGGSIVMKANGGSDQLKLQTGGLTVNCTTNFKDTIKVNDATGKTTGSFKVDDVGGGYYTLNFSHGILVGFEDHHKDVLG